MATGKIEPAKEGQTFKAKVGPNGETVDMEIKPKCDQNSGFWACITHDLTFRNQISKDAHISKGDHVLAWVCFEHGPEVP